jgi:Protein of unknown function (DUF2934)
MAKTRESSSPAAEKPRNGKYHPTREEIALRAYQIYQGRDGAPGDELSDWIMAERQLMEQNDKARRKPAPKAKSAAA